MQVDALKITHNMCICEHLKIWIVHGAANIHLLIMKVPAFYGTGVFIYVCPMDPVLRLKNVAHILTLHFSQFMWARVCACIDCPFHA